MLTSSELNISILISSFTFKFLIMWTSYLILIKTIKLSLISPVKYISKIVYSYKLNWFKPIFYIKTDVIY